MNSINCCIDCIYCIMANVPIEAGLFYTCSNPKGMQHFVNQWDNACIHFKEG